MINRTLTSLLPYLLAFFGQLLMAQWALSASLTTTVDRTQIGSGETVQLSVRFGEQASSEPDFSPLEHNFEVLSRSQQNRFSMANGSTDSYTEWLLQLLPKKTGKLIIPSLRYKGEISDAIEINVAKQSIATSANNQPIFIETLIDKDSLFVQEQLLLTFRLARSVNTSGYSADDLNIDNANIVKINGTEYFKNINGVRHHIVELKFAIFPENSGSLTIPSIRFATTIPERSNRFSSSFFDRGGKRIVLRSDEKTIQVKPRPQNSGQGEWLPSRGISISEQWSRPLDDLSTGEPITRTLHITAQGLAAAQLPPVVQPKGEGFKTYPDQPELTDDTDDSGVIGTRSESMAIVPTREGEITLPPITLEWWDTVNNKHQTTVLEKRTLQVQPSAELVNSAPPEVANSAIPIETAENPLPAKTSKLTWILLATNLLLLCALIMALVKMRQRRPSPSTAAKPKALSEAELFKAMKKSATQGKATAFREAAIKWAQAHWANPDLITLKQLAQQVGSPELTAGLTQLDKSLYGQNIDGVSDDTNHHAGENKVDLSNLKDQLIKLRQNSAKGQARSNSHSLEPLYENS